LPILGVGPAQGDAAALLFETDAGEMIDSFDPEKIKTNLLRHFNLWRSSPEPPVKKIGSNKYSRKEITAKLVELLT
jgi:hypothetical protein